MTTKVPTQNRSVAELLTDPSHRAADRQHARTWRGHASAALLVVVATLAAPHPAAALMPIPPAPVRFPIADLGHTILTLAEQYTQSPMPERQRLHHETVLLLNTAHAAL